MKVYAQEGLDLTKISFVDNQPIIDLIEKKPSGLFPMIGAKSDPKSTSSRPHVDLICARVG